MSASNIYGQTTVDTLSVTEPLALPPTAASFGAVSLCNNTVSYALSNYVTDPQSSPISYWIASSPLSNAALSNNGRLYVAGAWRASSNVLYSVVVGTSNIYGKSNTDTLAVTQVATSPPVAISLGNVTLRLNAATFALSSYYSDPQSSALGYWIVANPQSNVTLAGSTLTVQGANRGITYGVTVAASNIYGQVTTDALNVVEMGPSAAAMSKGVVANWAVYGNLTVGSNANTAYPLMVQTASAATNVSIYAAGDITAFSDARYKADIVPISDALAKVAAIGGYTFRRAADERPEAPRRAGVLAQELQAVLPEVIDVDAEGYMHVAYGNISALLIQAIKELRGRQAVLGVTTTVADEAFELALPALPIGSRWAAAFVSGSGAAYARTSVAVSDAGDAVVGRCELPGTYRVLVVAA